MRYMKWLGLLAVVILIVAAFIPWIFIESKNIIVTGVDSTGTNFGKPAYLHLLLSVFFIACTIIPRLWAKRVNLLIVAMNLAWAIRNYFVLSTCFAGECPERRIGIFLTAIASFIMLLSALFPDMKLEEKKPNHK